MSRRSPSHTASRNDVEMDRIMRDDRPSSSHSRSGWGDDEGETTRPTTADLERDQGGDDINPIPMEHDVFGLPNTAAREQQRQQEQIVVAPENQSCWFRFKKGVRGLWATRLTEDTKEDRELHVKTTLRELIVYGVFLVVLCIVSHGMVSSSMYYYSDVMQKLFLDTPFTDKTNTFRGMTALPEFWKYSQDTLLNGLHSEKWYNNVNMTQGELGYIMYESKILGRARLRQLKVRPDSCAIHDDFKNEIKECFDSYAKQIEDKRPFGLQNGSAWVYQNESELDAGNHWGLISTYGGGGYAVNLGDTRAESEAILQDLFDNLWIDRGTRAIFIDFTVYNANLNLFCVVRLVTEFPATGGVVPSWYFRTLKLIRYVSPFDYFIMVCECVFFIFIFYYMVEEILEIKRHKCSYFKSLFNILDIVIIVTSLICGIFNIYRTVSVSNKLASLITQDEVFMDFEFLSYWQTAFNYAIAWMVFFAWIKVFKYISFNKTMSQLSSTLAKCAKDVAGFAVMFFIIFFAYAQLGYLIFGTQVRDFRSFIDACFTQFRIVLGDFDFHELEQANRVLGPIYFMTYVFFVFFVLLNMFLAIINDTYSEVKSELANQKNEFEMGDYFKRGYSQLLSKLNLKRDKIVSLQQALQQADINDDQKVEFDEWRARLKMQGYSEQEIEAIFARYDKDGDRVLGADEQLRMREDLEGAKQAVDREFVELDDRGQRSKSAASGSFDSEDSDEDGVSKSSAAGGLAPAPGASYEEFTVLSRRVDRMEHSIGSIMSKIDAVLVKLEAMEKAKLKRRETMGKILDSITESDGQSEEFKREQMERLVREELERWDSETSLNRMAGASEASSSHTSGSHSRPGSSGLRHQGRGLLGGGRRLGSASSHGSSTSSGSSGATSSIV